MIRNVSDSLKLNSFPNLLSRFCDCYKPNKKEFCYSPGKTFGMEFYSNESELFRPIPKYICELIKKNHQSRLMQIG